MRSDAKPSSAGSSQRQATGLGRVFRGSFAARGASAGASGSGAPSRRGRRALVSTVSVLLAGLLLAASALAAKEVLNYIGPASGSGNHGAEFFNPLDVAVNTTGAGPADAGDIYVADQGNHRIQRFDADGEFVSAWGANVIHRDEVQTVEVTATAGTYTLTFDGATTAPIAHNASSAAVDNALDVLPSIAGNANVVVTGSQASGYTVVFPGTLAGTDVPEMTADDSGLTAPAVRGVEVATVEDGSGGQSTDYEICTEAALCGQAVASGGNGTSAGNGTFNQPQAVAVDGDTGDVYVSDRNNRRISRYDGEGNFIASFGFNVDATEAATTYEVCPAANVCKAGTAGSGVGQYGSGTTEGTFDIAVSPPDGEVPTGTVFLANSGNRRVETYGLDGSSPANFGSSANFGTVQPRKVTVDSRGILYASNSNDGAGIERYDTEDANGEGVGFLEGIAGQIDEVQTIKFPTFISFAEEEFTLTCPNGEQTDPMTFLPLNSHETYRATLESSCGGSFVVTNSANSTYTVAYQGSFAGTNIPPMTCAVVPGSGNGLAENQGEGECEVSAEVDGQPGPLLAAGNSSSDLSVATSGLAVDPGSDTLYVLRNPAEGDTVIEQFGPANEPGLTIAPTVTDEVHGQAAHFASAGGLGLDESADRLYVTATNEVPPTGSGHRVYVLGEGSTLPDPDLTVDEVTTKGETTATFLGSVDPKGALLSCKFEFSPDQAAWSSLTATDCDSLDVNGNVQAIGQEVTGLDPNTTYYVRLSASRTFVPGLTVTTPGVKVFQTDSVPPVVSDVGAIGVQDTSARLLGTIDPRKSATGYFFEYGTTPAMGSTTAPVEIGGGTTPITVSQTITGLAKDKTHYFRLVATNEFGSTPSSQKTFHTRTTPFPPSSPGNCPNEAIRKAQGSTYLPDCRAYEMVSPVDKNQGSVNTYFWGHFVAVYARDGDAAAFCTNAVFGEPAAELTGLCARYVSRRTASGWRTSQPFPRYCASDREGQDLGTVSGIDVRLGPELDRTLIKVVESSDCQYGLIDSAAPDKNRNVYRQDLTADPFSFDLLALNPVGGGANLTEFAGASDDFSRVFYTSQANQTPDSPGGTYDKLYGWEEAGHGSCAEPGGCLSLISKDPGGSPFTSASTRAGSTGDVNAAMHSHGVSTDGSRIYFYNGSGTNQRLYMREGNATTHDLSVSECSEECGANSSGEKFLWTNAAGDVALFASCDKLTDASAPSTPCGDEPLGAAGLQSGSGAKLYRWDRDAPPGSQLTDLAVDHEPNDGVQPNVNAFIGASDDGDVAYIVTAPLPTQPLTNGGQLVSGAPIGAGMRLYRLDFNDGSPSAEYLGPYVSESVSGGSGEGFTISTEVIDGEANALADKDRVTPDGEHLLLTTPLPLDPAADRDSAGYPTAGGLITGESPGDVYRWSGADGWTCVSCQLPGAPSAGRANNVYPTPHGVVPSYTNPYREITDDGQTIFFSSRDPLSPADVNGEAGCPKVVETNNRGNLRACDDVYVWHDGTLSRITPGDGASAILIGATADGESVFFETDEQLVGWDTDDGTDLYVARVNGGFPEPAAQPPECEGCRGSGTEAPETPGAGTAVFQGPGNPKAETRASSRCPGNRLRRGKRCLTVAALARKRCRRLSGTAKRRCVRRQAQHLRKAQRRAKRRAQRRFSNAHRANANRRASR